MSDNEFEGVSQEIEALIRFNRGRKLISINDIKEFSRMYAVGKAIAEKYPLKLKETTNENR